jgi:hypothetical protein
MKVREWLTSEGNRCIPVQRVYGTYYTRSWVGPRTCVDVVGNRSRLTFFPAWDRNNLHRSCSLLPIHYSLLSEPSWLSAGLHLSFQYLFRHRFWRKFALESVWILTVSNLEARDCRSNMSRATFEGHCPDIKFTLEMNYSESLKS